VIALQVNTAIATCRHENLPEIVAYGQLDAGDCGDHGRQIPNIGCGAGRIIEARGLAYDISLRGDQRVK